MEKDTLSDSQTTVTRYLPYLYEIRKRLLFIFTLFSIGWAIGFYYYQPLVLFVLRLYNLKGINIAFTSPFQFVNLAINAGIVIGAIVAFPLLTYQVLAFLKPALLPREFKNILLLLPLSIILFIAGFMFGTYIMNFVVVIFYHQTIGLNIQNLWDIDKFLSQVFLTAFLLGIIFQLPLILTLLLRCGVITHKAVSKQRLLIYVALLGIVILLPPTDLLSLALMFFPLAFIFEITLLLNKNTEKKLMKGGE